MRHLRMLLFITFLMMMVASFDAIQYDGLDKSGTSTVSRNEDGYGGYSFGYNEQHSTGETFRKESGRPGLQVGSYGLRDADGRIRVVNYVADKHGFRAFVSTNEPGIDAKHHPASTSFTFGAPTDKIYSLLHRHVIPFSYSFSTVHDSPSSHYDIGSGYYS
ncbi:hypothetical protein BLOT_011530 [Blomia tropicalis]|nr:hypothetical protein BLOT_011530 [Blomia tropicalis]